MEKIYFTLFAAIFSIFILQGCHQTAHAPKQLPPPIDLSNTGSSDSVFAKDIQYKLKEFVMIIFKKEMDQESWNRLMDSVRKVNINRQKIEELLDKDKMTESEEEALSELSIENANNLVEIYYSNSAYLLNWGEKENCTVIQTSKGEFNFTCKPLYDILGENPLNGGLPQPERPGRLVYKKRPGLVEKVPYLEFNFVLNSETYVEKPLEMLISIRADSRQSFIGEIDLNDDVTFKVNDEPVSAARSGIITGLWQ